MRRQHLAALGVQLPVLPTIVLGALPGPPEWSARLARIGLDVTASGAAADDDATLAAAAAAAPHLALKARPGPGLDLSGRRGLIVEGPGPLPEGCYPLGPGEAVVVGVDGASAAVEETMDVARRVLARAREGVASELWVAASPGLDGLDEEVVEAKLGALVLGAIQARLYLAKEQFDI